MTIISETKRIQKRTQELKDWWIDELIAHNIPMQKNETDQNELTEACEHAQARGATLVKVNKK